MDGGVDLKGDKGDQGPPGLLSGQQGIYTMYEETGIAGLKSGTAFAVCDDGDVVLLGGYYILDVNNNANWPYIAVQRNTPHFVPCLDGSLDCRAEGWQTTVYNNSLEPIKVAAKAHCIDVSEPFRPPEL